jgi:hypothetical protein
MEDEITGWYLKTSIIVKIIKKYNFEYIWEEI